MSKPTLLLKIKWINTDIPTQRIYYKCGKFISNGGNHLDGEISKRVVLLEFKDMIDSTLGYTKYVYMNTALFKEAFGNESVYKALKAAEML